MGSTVTLGEFASDSSSTAADDMTGLGTWYASAEAVLVSSDESSIRRAPELAPLPVAFATGFVTELGLCITSATEREKPLPDAPAAAFALWTTGVACRVELASSLLGTLSEGLAGALVADLFGVRELTADSLAVAAAETNLLAAACRAAASTLTVVAVVFFTSAVSFLFSLHFSRSSTSSRADW